MALVMTGCGGQPLVPENTQSNSNGNNSARIKEPETSVTTTTATATTSNNKPAESGSMSIASNELTPLDQLPMDKRLVILSPNGGLIEFDQKKFDNLLGNTPIGLFFYTNSCERCRVLQKRMIDDVKLLPGGVVLFKINTDKLPDLAKSYNAIVGQMIILGADGKEFSRNNGQDFNSLIIQLRKVME